VCGSWHYRFRNAASEEHLSALGRFHVQRSNAPKHARLRWAIVEAVQSDSLMTAR
jgi:hypothetical protein